MNPESKWSIESEPVCEPGKGKRAKQIWPLPTDEAFLEEFLTDLFTRYWDQMIFGPMIEGAAYEMICPRAPKLIRLFDGYLTISFGDSHFHLCIGENNGPPSDPTPQGLKARRKPSKAQIRWPGFSFWKRERPLQHPERSALCARPRFGHPQLRS